MHILSSILNLILTLAVSVQNSFYQGIETVLQENMNELK